MITRQPPVAGQNFTGVEVIDVNPRIEPLKRVVCNATLGSHALPVVQHVFTTAPPRGVAASPAGARLVAGLARAEKINKVEAITCIWQIPANAAGERLQLGSFAEPGLIVYTGATRTRNASSISSAPSWIVRPLEELGR
jgi:hypothetical protein